jgi:hypothetical protein
MKCPERIKSRHAVLDFAELSTRSLTIQRAMVHNCTAPFHEIYRSYSISRAGRVASNCHKLRLEVVPSQGDRSAILARRFRHSEDAENCEIDFIFRGVVFCQTFSISLVRGKSQVDFEGAADTVPLDLLRINDDWQERSLWGSELAL